jgi:hypothetical protein
MHLITQPLHVLPCSNSAMKGNNGSNKILYHDIADQIITEPPPPPVSLLAPGIADCRLPWFFYKQKLPDVGNSIKNNSVALVRKRTIPAKRPPLFCEDSANFLRIEGVAWLAQRIPMVVFSVF